MHFSRNIESPKLSLGESIFSRGMNSGSSYLVSKIQQNREAKTPVKNTLFKEKNKEMKIRF